MDDMTSIERYLWQRVQELQDRIVSLERDLADRDRRLENAYDVIHVMADEGMDPPRR